MAYRWKPKNLEIDPENPRANGVCDRCGFITNLHKLQFQFNYEGSTMLQNSGFLVCTKCYDAPNPQDMPIILSADPVPVMNARPEPVFIDQGSWILTQDGEIITDEDGDLIGTGIPNPDDNAATAHLEAYIPAPGQSVAALYLDIFDGNPLTVGVSKLRAITGSATRTDIASQLAVYPSPGRYANPERIVVTLVSQASCNSNFIGLYDAATAGTLIMSAPMNVRGPFVNEDNPVVFDALALTINLFLNDTEEVDTEALGSAAERRGASGLNFIPLPVVTPDATPGRSWRERAAGSYGDDE